MTTTVSDKLYKSQLLDYYYQRRAESSINIGERFLISKAVFGTSALVTKTMEVITTLLIYRLCSQCLI